VLGELLLFLPQTIAFVILPELVRATGLEKRQSVAKVARVSIFISTLLALGLFSTGHYLIQLVYGSEYLDSYRVLCLLLPGLVISSVRGAIVPYYTSMARQKVTIVCSLLSLSLNAGLNLVLIPAYGVCGAAFTTSVTYSVFSLTLIVLFKREHRCSYADLLFIKKEDFSLPIAKFQQMRFIKYCHLLFRLP
jgi:O-antigen/teichoic acid export membrane protein